MSGFGPFEVVEVVGETPAGFVYRGRRVHADSQVETSSSCSVRIHTLLRGRDCCHPVAQEFFRRRHAASALSEHPHFTRLLDAGSQDGVAYYVCAEPAGSSLPNYWRSLMEALPAFGSGADSAPATTRRVALPTLPIRGWIADIASTLNFAHERGIILGNLSPDSVWIAADRSAALIDPGHHGRDRWIPGPSRDAVRYAFLAPEQLMGRPLSPRTDVYALGMILFWMLSPELPVDRYQEAALIGRYLPLPPIDSVSEPFLASVCRKATQVSPAARFPSADLLRAEVICSQRDRAAAAHRATRAARHTLIRGIPSQPDLQPGRLRNYHRSVPPATRLVRWLQNWIQ